MTNIQEMCCTQFYVYTTTAPLTLNLCWIDLPHGQSEAVCSGSPASVEWRLQSLSAAAAAAAAAAQQRGLPPSSSQSDSPLPQGSPQMPRPPAACDGASGGESLGASPQHTSTPLGFSPGPLPEGSGSQGTSTPTTSSGCSSQQSPLLLATGTSNLSPCLIPSTVLSLSQAPSALNSMQAMTLPISHSAPHHHSPPLPHSAPLSRAMTPIQLMQQAGSGGSQVPSLNPLLMKAAEMYATSTLPLPRRPVSEMRLGGFQGKVVSFGVCPYRLYVDYMVALQQKKCRSAVF